VSISSELPLPVVCSRKTPPSIEQDASSDLSEKTESCLAARRKVLTIKSGEIEERREFHFSALASSPGGALPILSRWRRIVRTSAGSMMTAMSLISEPHRGQRAPQAGPVLDGVHAQSRKISAGSVSNRQKFGF
jgi:hypothetical protein